MKTVSFYSAGQLSTPSRQLTIQEAYQLFQSGLQEETAHIQRTYHNDLQDNFPAGKTAYQADKKRLLPGIAFAGNIDRSLIDQDFQHSSLLTLDVDENTPDQLADLFSLIKSGRLVYIEAAARSVSGFVTGALWVNIRVQVPEDVFKLPKRLKTLLNIKDQMTRFEALSRLQEGYWKAFQHLFKKELRISIGSAGKDLKRVRYIAHDPDLYLNDDAQVYRLDLLEAILNDLQKQKDKDQEGFDHLAVDIQADDAFSFAEAFAEAKGYKFEKGQRHLFLTTFSIATNLLGVDQSQTEDYIKTRFSQPINGNFVSYPYQHYADSFGRWKYRIPAAEKAPDFVFELKEGQRLSDHADQLADLIITHKKIDLKSGTGTGKNYAVVRHIAPLLKVKTGLKTVIICSLNAKAEKDADQYSLPYITGEALRKAGQQKQQVFKEALKADLLLCNQNAFPKIAAYLHSRGQQIHSVIDEAHTLITGSAEGYKPGIIAELWGAVERVSASVTLMTGTPKPYFVTVGFKRVEVRQISRPAIFATVKNFEGNAAAVVLQHIEKTDLSRKRLVIKLQSKKGIRLIKEHLIRNGFHADQVVCLYSDSNVKASQEYQRFISAKADQQSFADQAKVILCTSFVNEGLDIYDAFDLEFVNVEKESAFDADDLVQFADRWRIDQSKTLISYHKAPKDRTFVPFDRLTAFQDALTEYKQIADLLTAKEKRFFSHYAAGRLVSLKNDFSDREKLIYWNSDKQSFDVNFLALAAKIDIQSRRQTSTAAGWKLIGTAFPYFKINFEDLVFADQQTAQSLDQLAEVQKEVAAEVQDVLTGLYQTDQETLFQAVGSVTTDADLKKSIDFKADRKDDAERLKSAHAAIFTDHISEAERLVRTWQTFRKSLLPDLAFDQLFFKDDPTGRTVFASAQKLTVFLTGLKLHLLLTFRETAAAAFKTGKAFPVLNILQAEDAKQISAFAGQINMGDRLSDQDVFRIYKTTVKGLVSASASKSKAVRLLNILFEVEKERASASKAIFYTVKQRRSFEAFLTDQGLDRPAIDAYATALHNMLKNSNLNDTIKEDFYILRYSNSDSVTLKADCQHIKR